MGAGQTILDFTVLSIFLPAWNEEPTIEEAIGRVLVLFPGANVVVVDDGSTDGTYGKLLSMQSECLTVLRTPKNLGKGGAIKFGIGAFEVSTRYFAYLDADLDLCPSSLLRGMEALEDDLELSAAVGSKLHPDSIINYVWYRKLLSIVFRNFLRLLFSLSINDTQTGLKIFRTEHVAGLVENIGSNGWTFDLELMLELQDQGLKILEIPVDLAYKFSSSINVGSAYQAVLDVLRVWSVRRLVR